MPHMALYRCRDLCANIGSILTPSPRRFDRTMYLVRSVLSQMRTPFRFKTVPVLGPPLISNQRAIRKLRRKGDDPLHGHHIPVETPASSLRASATVSRARLTRKPSTFESVNVKTPSRNVHESTTNPHQRRPRSTAPGRVAPNAYNTERRQRPSSRGWHATRPFLTDRAIYGAIERVHIDDESQTRGGGCRRRPRQPRPRAQHQLHQYGGKPEVVGKRTRRCCQPSHSVSDFPEEDRMRAIHGHEPQEGTNEATWT